MNTPSWEGYKNAGCFLQSPRESSQVSNGECLMQNLTMVAITAPSQGIPITISNDFGDEVENKNDCVAKIKSFVSGKGVNRIHKTIQPIPGFSSM